MRSASPDGGRHGCARAAPRSGTASRGSRRNRARVHAPGRVGDVLFGEQDQRHVAVPRATGLAAAKTPTELECRCVRERRADEDQVRAVSLGERQGLAAAARTQNGEAVAGQVALEEPAGRGSDSATRTAAAVTAVTCSNVAPQCVTSQMSFHAKLRRLFDRRFDNRLARTAILGTLLVPAAATAATPTASWQRAAPCPSLARRSRRRRWDRRSSSSADTSPTARRADGSTYDARRRAWERLPDLAVPVNHAAAAGRTRRGCTSSAATPPCASRRATCSRSPAAPSRVCARPHRTAGRWRCGDRRAAALRRRRREQHRPGAPDARPRPRERALDHGTRPDASRASRRHDRRPAHLCRRRTPARLRHEPAARRVLGAGRAALAARAAASTGARRDGSRSARPLARLRRRWRRRERCAASTRSTSARRWRRLPDLPTARHGLGVVRQDGRIYVVAGGRAPASSSAARTKS